MLCSSVRGSAATSVTSVLVLAMAASRMKTMIGGLGISFSTVSRSK
jgi:hypothetical protein